MSAFRVRLSSVAFGIAGTVIVGLASKSAIAQSSFDDPPPTPMTISYTWTGFYAGLNAGGHWSENNTVQFATSGAPLSGVIPGSLKTELNGFTGGGQFGYNWQTAGVVVGLEADIQGVDANRTAAVTLSGPAPFATTATTSARRKLEYLGTVRARLGVTPNPITLLYATGGFAYGGTELSATTSGTGTGVPAFSDAQKSSNTATGWTAGGGAEFAVGANTILRGEYLYYDLGEEKLTLDAGVAGSIAAKSEYTGHIARVGISFKF